MIKSKVGIVLIFLFVPICLFSTYLGLESSGLKGGKLTLILTTAPQTLNPFNSGTGDTSIIGHLLGRGGRLAEYNEIDKKYYPGIAENWKGPRITKDGGMEILFYLRKGIKWSDGKPFSVDDVIFTFNNIILNPKFPNRIQDQLKTTNGILPEVTKIDDFTFRVYYKEIYRPAFDAIVRIYILPKHVWEPQLRYKKITEIWDIGAISRGEAVGLGPFIPVEYVPDQYVRLVRNPYYWKKDKNGQQLPYLDEVVYKIVPNYEAGKLTFLTGGADVFAPRGADVISIREKGNFIVYRQGPTQSIQYLAFNFNAKDPIKRNWFRNIHFRKAIAYSINKTSLINVVYHGLAVEQNSVVAFMSPFYNENIVVKYKYDISRAKAELLLGGFKFGKDGILYDKKGNKVEFTLVTDSSDTFREQICNILINEWKKIGISSRLVILDRNIVSRLIEQTGEWEAVVSGLMAFEEPQLSAHIWRSDGIRHFWNFHPKVAKWVSEKDYVKFEFEEQVDKILENNVLTLDDEIAKNYWYAFQRIISENLPIIPLVSSIKFLAWNEKLKNVTPGELDSINWCLDRIYIEEFKQR
ncbi:MAG: ABC transporter substrate-binding protein [Fervidobacterium sp.]|nr:ABC transporter substrate-binding protein [Fervidobacterium sp.]